MMLILQRHFDELVDCLIVKNEGKEIRFLISKSAEGVTKVKHTVLNKRRHSRKIILPLGIPAAKKGAPGKDPTK